MCGIECSVRGEDRGTSGMVGCGGVRHTAFKHPVPMRYAIQPLMLLVIYT